MDRLSRQLKAVSDPQRMRILALLAYEGECAVSEIQQVLSISASAASRSLRTLEETGWLERRRDSRWIYYSFTSAPEGLAAVADALLRRMQQEPQHLADRERLRTDRSASSTDATADARPAVRPGTARLPADGTPPGQRPQHRVELPYATTVRENHQRPGNATHRPVSTPPPPQPPAPTPKQPVKTVSSGEKGKKKKRGILFDFGHK